MAPPQSADAADELTELIQFLADVRSELRREAHTICQALTGSAQGVESLVPKREKLLPALLRTLADPHEDISKASASILVNVSGDPRFVMSLLNLNVTDRVMDAIREKSCPHHDLLMMLLSNVTVSDLGCEALLQLGKEKLEGLHLAMLLRFLMSNEPSAPLEGEFLSTDETVPDRYQHIGLILMNVTRLKKGRELLLQPGRGLLQVLAAQLRSPSVVRRRGCAGALRNCFLRAGDDETLPSILEEKQAIVDLMHPISATIPKEKDESVREQVAEAVLCLSCYSEARGTLWELGVHEILRKGYELEENRTVCQAMEKAVDNFMSDGAQRMDGDDGDVQDALILT